MTVCEKGLVTVLACDALFALIALPLALGKVRRNPVYGYRTPATLSSDEVWYAANAHFGRGFLVAALVTAAAALVLRPAFTLLSPPAFLNASIAFLVTPLAVAAIRTARFVRTLQGPGAAGGR